MSKLLQSKRCIAKERKSKVVGERSRERVKEAERNQKQAWTGDSFSFGVAMFEGLSMIEKNLASWSRSRVAEERRQE